MFSYGVPPLGAIIWKRRAISFPRGGGGAHKHFLDRNARREQISTTQKKVCDTKIGRPQKIAGNLSDAKK